MELRVLQYFLAVAREQSISRAAQSLHLSQPTLSTQIKALEEELGKKLLDRGVSGSRKVTLTDEGIILRKRAEEILSLVKRTEDEITLSDQFVAGDVYIGAGETDGVRLLTRAAQRTQERYPDVHFHISSGDGADVTDDLDKGLTDFGLLLQTVDISRYDCIELPVRETWGVLVRRDSHLASLERVTPEDLIGTPLLMSRRQQVKDELASWFGDCFQRIELAGTFNLILNAANMVLHGVGAALGFYLADISEELRFIPLSPELRTGTVLVWKKDQASSNAASAFLREVRNVRQA